MAILDRIKERIKNPALAELVKDQNLKDLLVKREFRITQGYLQREIFSRAVDEELPEFSVKLGEGYGQVSGKVKKRLLPFTIPFSATFTIQGVEFSATRKLVLLKLEQVAPVDFDWLTRKFVERIPCLSMMGGDVIACDLAKVPRLAELFSYRITGLNPWDFIVLKELAFREGEVAGKVGVVL
jgi:hypothetical protein